MLSCEQLGFNSPWRSTGSPFSLSLSPSPTQRSTIPRLVNEYRIIPGLTLDIDNEGNPHRWWYRLRPGFIQCSFANAGQGDRNRETGKTVDPMTNQWWCDRRLSTYDPGLVGCTHISYVDRIAIQLWIVSLLYV